MDSGNSGSLQSSSGGDEEYDSRAAVDSISTFMTTHQPSTHLRPISAPPPPLFDPLSNYLQLHQNPNPVWPGIQRSDPNPTTLDIINSPHFFQPTAADNNHGVPPPPQNPNHAAARNPKKRSRASRRAPTTVLTTDTTNFRAMVQEFTGIPAAPFSNSSFPPPYLRRPFPQKVQSPPSFLGPSSSSASSLLNSTTALDSSTTQNSNLFNNNIPNPFLASLLQTNPKFIFNKLPDHHQGSFEIPPSNDHRHSNIKMDGLDYVTGLPNLISSDPRNDNNNNNNSNAVGPDEGDHRDDYEARMRSVNGGYNFTRNTTSSAAAAANFNGEKMGSETTTRGGEGMVESWICSSELK